MPSGPHKRAALRKKKQRQQQQQGRFHSKPAADHEDAGSVELEEGEEEEEEGIVSPGTPVTDRESPVVPLPSPLPDEDPATKSTDWARDSSGSTDQYDHGGTQEEQEHIPMQEHITATLEEDKGQEQQQGEEEKGRRPDDQDGQLLKPPPPPPPPPPPQPAAGCSCGILDWLLGRD